MPGRQTERFLTTVLFTDIVGSTEVAVELGDRGWRDLVQEDYRLSTIPELGCTSVVLRD
ncbi:MAG: hypothetical protein ABJC24_06935 [Chloroflexota bacterium]